MKRLFLGHLASPSSYFLFRKRSASIRVRRILYKGRTSAPYLSGDAFANLAEYAPYGSNGEKTPSTNQLLLAKSIFVPGHMLEHFLQEFKGSINAKVLITGNSDQNFVTWPEFPPSITLWMGQNLALDSNVRVRTITIPIGLENLALGRAGLPRYFCSQGATVTNKVLVPPMAPSNPIRKQVLNALELGLDPYVVHEGYLPEKKYFTLVSEYKFVLCLEGNGFENHRIWETLYRNAFPVLLRTEWSRQLANLGLPILFISNLEDCTEEVLVDFYSENHGFRSVNAKTLWIDYWQSIVKEYVAEHG